MADTNQKVTVYIEPKETNQITVSDVKKQSEFLSRKTEKGLINETSGSSIALRENGQINITSGRYAHLKANPSGSIDETSMQHTITTNRLHINSDELVINQHKFNQHLIELSDFRKVKIDMNENAVVGNFCVNGSVLVKAWEHNLKRYVLIRRPARVPMFSPLLNVPEINKGMGIDDPLYMPADLVGLSKKGYQVNAEISDAASLIGKEGKDRAGITRIAGGEVTVSSSSTNSGFESNNNSSGEYGVLSGENDSNFSDTENFMWRLAQKTSDYLYDKTNFRIEPEMFYRQWHHESGTFSSDLYKYDHNIGGLCYDHTPTLKEIIDYDSNFDDQGKGVEVLKQTDGGTCYYRHYKNWEDFSKSFIDDFMIPRINRGDLTTSNVTTIEGYAQAMHDSGYYTGGLSVYISGMKNAQIPNTKGYSETKATSNNVITSSDAGTKKSSQQSSGEVDMSNATRFEFTAYCPDGSDMQGGFGTATGVSLIGKEQSAHLVAVDPNVIPLHSKIYIEFDDPNWTKWNGVYSAVDTGGAIKGNIIDIFVGCYQYDLAMQFGRQHGKVKIIS